jgi:hypothetical protein
VRTRAHAQQQLAAASNNNNMYVQALPFHETIAEFLLSSPAQDSGTAVHCREEKMVNEYVETPLTPLWL